ncbi:MAG: M81 family metallopeptidase [Phyllobacterium sp.]|uniref:M81 family metallopeptidase n=1 Tax=Phyllobacterium sp. TaxID=1871046 RepID=UPI0030F15529
MRKTPPRVLVARIWHESNGFNPRTTQATDFQVCEGDVLLRTAASSGSTLGGIIARLQDMGCQIIPSLSVTAPPSGLVEQAFYEAVKSRLLADVALYRPDAIALELHGAMGTTQHNDAEGDLLQSIRAVAGDDVPIGIGLDLHAHVSDAMLEAVEVCIACKENPHSDVIECGYKVAECLYAILNGQLRPVTTMAKVPMILPGAAETAQGPLFDIHEAARQMAEADGAVWDISLFNVFRYVDDVDIGQAVVVLANGNSTSGEVALPLACAFWRERARFKDDLLTIEEALTKVAQVPAARPFILADMGDRVLAGAPGDSTAILATALKRSDQLRGAIPITDPESVKTAWLAGKGNSIELAVGGRITPGFQPLTITGKVVHLSDGDFVLSGPFQGGEPASMGPTAVIEIEDRIALVVTTKAAFSHDPAVFTSQGIDLASRDFFVVKSGYHFKLNFGAGTVPLLVRSPGVGYYSKGMLAYSKARFWPEHELGEPPIKMRVFGKAGTNFASPSKAQGRAHNIGTPHCDDSLYADR